MTTISEREVMKEAVAETPDKEITVIDCNDLNEIEGITFASLDEITKYMKNLRREKQKDFSCN
ncbi:MAG: hypothetical protein FWE49_05940 [Synergistaceae bacterium]|nr:hypothetical protein [Synergistaceae bacterium]